MSGQDEHGSTQNDASEEGKVSSPAEDRARLTLPEHTRLFHIGPPKTATTALQSAGAANRSELLKHGVLYPGRGLNHRGAVAAFLDRRIGWGGPGSSVPPKAAWKSLMAQIEREHSRRIWFGHEYAAGADEQMARRLAEAIGPDIHIAITLRSYAAMLPSIWQEYLKGGNTGTFDSWLRRVLTEPRIPAMIHKVHVRHDQGELVQRWAKIVGANNVTVIVLDKSQPELVFDAFEELLDLPTGLLRPDKTDGRSANRSMSVPEIELLRRINITARGSGVRFDDYSRLVNQGVVARMLRERSPSSDEPGLRLPAWAAEKAGIQAERFAQQISASGVRVVGDLSILTRPVPTREQDAPKHQRVDQVPLAAAVEAVAGLLSQALGRGSSFEPAILAEETGSGEDMLARDLTTAELVGIIERRARSKGIKAVRAVRRIAAERRAS